MLAKHRDFLIRKRKHDYLLRGFIYCGECGQRYTADKHKINSIEKNGVIHYYHCQKRDRNGCLAPYVEAGALEMQVEKELEKLQFSQEFIDTVVQKAKDIVAENRRTIDAQKQGIINQKTVIVTKRNKLEDAIIDGIIDRDTYKRKHDEFTDKITNFNNLIQEIESNANLDISLIEEVLAFTRNIHATYMQAPQFLKRHYLRFFFERFVMKERRILRVEYTPIFSILQENHQVIITYYRLRD